MTTFSAPSTPLTGDTPEKRSSHRLRKLLKILLGLVMLLALVWLVYHFAIKPRIDRWGATPAEIAAALPGDELVPQPASIVNHVVTIQAAPEQIFPWLLQLGAKRGGLYSYDWLETNILRCALTNADRIHPEWQNLQLGDKVEMCPDQALPPPYTVSMIAPNQALVMGHEENGEWTEQWQFVLLPQADGSTRLVLRTRTMMTGGFWDIIHPGVFIMERGMLLGIRDRAEKMAEQS